MLEVAVGFVLGAVVSVVPLWIAGRTIVQILRANLAERDSTIADLHDRLAARTWPEYKAVVDATPEVDPHAGMVWAHDPTGTYGDWIPREQAVEQGLVVD